jgi:phospholipase C
MKRLAVLLVVAMATACSSSYPPSALPAASQPGSNVGHRSSFPITHVVIIMQENRSFDNFFHGFPGANSATSGYGHGVKYTLQELPLKYGFDLNHYHYQFLEDYDGGKSDGWDRLIHMPSPYQQAPSCPYADWVNHPSCWQFWTTKQKKQLAFSYVKKSDIQAYWTMASQYTLGDHNFASTNGPSFGPHQELITGQEGHASEVPSNMPWGCDAPQEKEWYLQYGQADPPEFPPAVGHEVLGGDPCFTYASVADLLDNAKVTWRWYKQPDPTPSKSSDSYWLDAFDAIKAVRNGPDYANVVTPDWQIVSDITSGKLAQVSWVMPHGGASDHPGGGSGACGPAWVTEVVNAIGQSQYWKSTAIVITWDEWGGWFDHLVPPQYPNSQTHALEGLGYRVPLIIVSPYAKKHYVSKSQHETASALHFIEQMFGLPFIGHGSSQTFDDQRADWYQDAFNFSQNASTFKAIPKPANYQYCLAQQQTAPAEMDY